MAEKKAAAEAIVLMIDDDEFIAGLYAHKLTKDGFKVVLAQNGPAGIEAARKLMPDVILLDVIMPEMNGFEVLHRLKKDEKTSRIPVIMLTSLGQQFDVERGLEEGAIAYFVKTKTVPEETTAAVRKAIAGSRA
jgi:CheY-like chemotaxis protein